MTDYRDDWWRSPDGLRLHYRDYPGDPGRAPVLCIPGLTRNARDFEAVAERLAGSRRVIVVELRGRGESEWAPDFESYNVKAYLEDVRALLAELGLDRMVLFGTSLGGILSMLLGATDGARIAGLLLNDVAPIVEEAGLERIRGYIGSEARWPGWAEATAAIATTHGPAFPDYGPADWDAMTRRLAREEGGAVVGDYDPKIAILVAMPSPPPPPEPWQLIEAFRNVPGLLVYGALSDILSADVAAETVRRLPEMELLTLSNMGHVPTLDEPEARAAVDRLLARVDSESGTKAVF